MAELFELAVGTKNDGRENYVRGLRARSEAAARRMTSQSRFAA
jgi:hypothetical protein